MRQQSFASLAEGQQERITRKAEFFKRMDTPLVPWNELQSLFEPHYPKGKRGRPPIGLDRMLRMYFLQQWFPLSDEAVEDALYDMRIFRDFVGVDLWEESAPDATIIDAPSSTKNTDKARDPEMHQTKTGNQWYFGMKAHIGADIESGVVHSVHTTAANEADVTQTEHLLHGDEQSVWVDAGYTGADKRDGLKDKAIDWMIYCQALPGQET